MFSSCTPCTLHSLHRAEHHALHLLHHTPQHLEDHWWWRRWQHSANASIQIPCRRWLGRGAQASVCCVEPGNYGALWYARSRLPWPNYLGAVRVLLCSPHLFFGIKSPISQQQQLSINRCGIQFTILYSNTQSIQAHKSSSRSIRKFNLIWYTNLELKIAMSTFRQRELPERILST